MDTTDSPTEGLLDRQATLFQALGTTRKLTLLGILLQAEEALTSSSLATLSGLTEPQTSWNLTKLREVGLVHRATQGRYSFYTPNREVLSTLADLLTQEPPNNES